MPLNWNLTACEDYKQLSSAEMWPVTEAIIFMTMAIDMGQLTDDNIEKFLGRVVTWEMLNGTMLKVAGEGGEIINRPLTLEDLRLRIGLRTNVTTTSDVAFKNKMARRLKETSETAVQEQVKRGS